MAIHRMECKGCAHLYDAMSGVILDPSLTTCPKCGGTDLSKVLHGKFAVHMHDSKNMHPDEIAMALEHRDDLEQNRDHIEFREKGPLEFRPRFERTLY